MGNELEARFSVSDLEGGAACDRVQCLEGFDYGLWFKDLGLDPLEGGDALHSGDV